ncbi:TadE/TadG family type IV pilus assembly protein [Azohydromonas lata]|uniref:TadE/TadG family type IV pilus assembly protein n=1 Tax=Azohydromonas lata TaxID=45677 RepID=UPI0014721A65|nr:TadE family protein [Azohydromonas lata]
MHRVASPRSSQRHWRGSALLELVAVVPILALLAGLSVEFGRVLYTYNTITKAVRSATRHLALTDSSNASSAAWTQARQEACQLALFGTLAGGSTPLLTGLTSSMVQIDTSGRLVSTVYGNSGSGCGTNCGISWVRVTISGYRYTPLLGSVLPASVLQGGQLALEPIRLTMRGWPFATATPTFASTSTSCAALI